MEASTAACVLMDRYQLVLQRTQNVTALVGHHVRAIGPGPAGQPSAWFETTAEAVADWVAKHGPTYTPASGRETWFRAPETWIRVEPRPLEVPATSGYCHPVDQADGQGARG
jgi:hypothetical protein